MSKKYTNYYYIIPLAVFIVFFILLPIIGSIYTSFFRDVTFLPEKFIFLNNYIDILNDKSFMKSLKFTLLFILFAVPLELILGIMFAVILDIKIPFRGILRAVVLIPWAIPSAISAKLWQLIYNYSYGLANYVMVHTGVSDKAINWLGTDVSAFFAVLMADVWKTVPFVTILILAGLQTVGDEIKLQAKIDRANFVQIFFKITLPLIKPVCLVALLFRTIDSLRIFDVIYVLTNGGPGGATTSVSLYAYKYFLGGDFGYGSAVSIVLFIIAFIMSYIYVRVARFQAEL